MKENKININYYNTGEKYVKKYKKFFCNQNVIDIQEKIKKVKEKINVNKDNKLYDEYLKFNYLYENSGLLLDGNFEFLNSINNFFEHDFFIGYKDTKNIGTNIIYVKNVHNKYIKEILDLIEEDKFENITEVFSVIFKKDLSFNYNSIEQINKKIYIYPYEYFYPIDYENIGKDFTSNLKCLFYEKNKKISLKKKFKIKTLKKISPVACKYFFSITRHVRNNVGYKKYLFQQNIKKKFTMKKDLGINRALEVLNKYIEFNKNNEKSGEKIDYVIIHNPNWLGVTSATKELFKNLLPLEEIYLEKNINLISNKIIQLGVKQVIFSAFDYGWDKIAIKLKELNPNIKLKSFWHGSHSQVIEKINWETNVMVINLHKRKIIDVMGTCKESMFNFYKSQGYNAAFIKNTVNFTDDIKDKIKNNSVNKDSIEDKKNINIGLYAAGVDWRKNTYNQIMACSLFDNSILELVPLKYDFEKTAFQNNLKIKGKYEHIKRDDLLVKMSENDLNLYVTFSECAPMLPIESLEAGTICITGNNHHYFNGTKLYDYLVVEREDDVMDIYNKMKFALENKEKILNEYKIWKKEYDKSAYESVDQFLKM